jgi:hypothetical protein
MDELDITRLGWRGSSPRAENTPDLNIASVAIYADLEHGFMGNTLLALAMRRTQAPVGHVNLSGLGLHAPHFFPGIEKSSLAVLSGYDVASHWERISKEAFEADELRRVVRDWFHAIVAKHLAALRPFVSAELETQRRRHEIAAGRVGSGVSVYVNATTATATWLTRSASGPLMQIAGRPHRRR